MNVYRKNGLLLANNTASLSSPGHGALVNPSKESCKLQGTMKMASSETSW